MKKAFSLLELIFIIVIIAIITSFALPKFLDTKDKAQATAVKRDISSIISSIQSYYLLNEKLDNISDAIDLDSSVWEIESQKVIFKDKEKNCIILEVQTSNNKIALEINEDSGATCLQLKELGIQTIDYKLY